MVPAAFFLLLSSCWLQQVSSRKVWQLQLWPEGPASPVLAPGTLASHLVSHFGYFSAAPLCFAENMEQRLTERIHFHCSFNSQLISQELCTLPLTTSTMFFQKLNLKNHRETFCSIFRTDHQNVVSEWKLRLEVLYFHHRSTEMKPRRKRYEDFWHLCDTPVSAETWYMLDTIRKTKHGVQTAPSEHGSDDHLNSRNEYFISCLGKILTWFSSVIILVI